LHRFDVCDRRDNTCATDLKDDFIQYCFGLFGGVFVRNGPSGCFCSGTEFVLLGDAVDFDDDAVDVVG